MDRIQNRIGKFSIAGELVSRHPESLLPLFTNLVVIRCEHVFYQNIFEYQALSPLFDEVPHGWRIPEYRVVGQRLEDGSVSYSFQRV